MRTSERHHLKHNELARALQQASEYVARNRRAVSITVGIVAVVAVAATAFLAWRTNAETRARALLAEAIVTYESRVSPPPPPTGTTLDDRASVQPPGTFPSERAKLETALPKFMAAADAYPSTDAGRTARYYAAATLVGLGRFDEAIRQYDQLGDGGGLLAQAARLGRAEAQLRAAQYDPAIASFKELAERTDTNLPKEAILLELARAYKLAGKTEEARKTLNQIVEQHGASPFATEAKQELDKLKG